MKKATHLLAVTLLATATWLGAVASCSDDEPDPIEAQLQQLRSMQPDPDLVAYLKTNFGVRLTGLEEAADFTYERDGTLIASAEGVIEVDGLGSTDIYIHERIYSQASGGDVELYVEDLKTGDSRYFYYDPADSFVIFSRELEEGRAGLKDPERGAVVARNEDGTYTVWTFDDTVSPNRENEQRVDDGYEALALVNDFAEFNTIPPYIMLTAIAIGYTAVPESRLPIICLDTDAVRPSVCSIFKEFCDCAACLVAGREGCDLCPER